MKLSFLILAMMAGLALFAQKKRDVVYLKNGSILRGTVVMEDPGKLIKLKTPDSNLWVFQYDQIDSITHFTRPDHARMQPTTGYYNLTEIGFLVGNYSNANRAPLFLMNISSWYLATGFSAGVGLGVEFSNETYLPVVADIRYYIRDKRPLPFFSLQAGYDIALGGSYARTVYAIDDIRVSPAIYPGIVAPMTDQDINARGGFLVNPAVGIQTPLSENLSMTFSAGYRWMRHSYSGKDDYRLDIDYNRLSLKIGLLFK